MLQTSSISSIFLKNKTKFRNNDQFFLQKFLNQSVRHGKKYKYFNTYYTYFVYLHRDKLYKHNATFRYVNSPKTEDKVIFYLNVYKSFWMLNTVLSYFFKYNTLPFSFFVEKQKTFVNHKKRFFDKINYHLVTDKNSRHIFFKFVKTLYLRNKYKSRLLNFVNNDLYCFQDSSFMLVFKNIIFDLVITKKNK